MTIDDLRAAHPELGFALYAMEPGKPVTFEVYTPDGQVYSFTGASAEGAMGQAFPPSEIAPEPAQQPTPAASVFD